MVAAESLTTEQGAEAAGSAAKRLRVVNLGISSSEICGVRDYARVVGQALAEQGVDASMHWCNTVPGPFRTKRWDVCRWLDELAVLVETSRPDALILHYSVVDYGFRGLPVFVPTVAHAIRRAALPVVGVLHELAYPFGRRGWRGSVHAVSHRLVLPTIANASDVLIVTTEHRLRFVRRRRVLRRRPSFFAPVCSNLPSSAKERGHVPDGRLRMGVLGFGSSGAEVQLVAATLRILDGWGVRLRLCMLGAPGSEGSAAEAWRAAAGRYADIEFTGVLAAAELADALAAQDFLLIPDRAGADSRRGLLAAGLGAGRTVLTFDGPERWMGVVKAGAALLVPLDPDGLACSIAGLARDPSARARQEKRALGFYEHAMSPSVVACRVREAIEVSISRGEWR